MPQRSPFRTHALLVVLGVALVWVASTTGGVATNAAYEYTAYEVEHADGELRLTNARTGRTVEGARAEKRNVDERIVCLPSHTRQCSFERRALDGNLSVEGIGSEYRYAYRDGEFYRIESRPLGEYEHERTDPADAFAELAVDSDRLSPGERDAVESGRTVSTREFANTNRLVRRGDTYYTIFTTARKSYGSGGSFCSSSGNGFCGDADSLRWKLRLRSVGIGLLGAVGVLVGARGLFGAWRSN